MNAKLPRITDEREARRLARLFPSFRDFVDDALFHPAWGYYGTGRVRFGEGGHYDTFPVALSPLFGRMLAQYAHRFWRRMGAPRTFELCEIGAGNGQLCLDVLLAISERARHVASWKRFAAAFRYRIIERSRALIARQREHLGAVADRVAWTRADLTQAPAKGAPFGPCGIVFANEVLDCLAHHKVVFGTDGSPGVVLIVPTFGPTVRVASQRLRLVRGIDPHDRAVPRASLAAVFRDDRLRARLGFREVALPVETMKGLAPFLRGNYPEFFHGRRFRPYFACPSIEPLIANTTRLYRTMEQLWIDYGHTRSFHLEAPESQRVFAGPPRSGASIYRAPGLDDITFMVDFSVVQNAAGRAGLEVAFYGGQAELARRSGVVFDRGAVDLIVRYRGLSWMLAVMGIGPERQWRSTGLTWNVEAARGGRLRDDVRRGVDEFLGKRRSPFKLLILRRPGRRPHHG